MTLDQNDPEGYKKKEHKTYNNYRLCERNNVSINIPVKCYNKYREVIKHIKKLLPEAITTSNKALARPAKYMSLYHLKHMLTPTKPRQLTPEEQSDKDWLVAVNAEAQRKTTTADQYIEFIEIAHADRAKSKQTQKVTNDGA